MNETLLLYPIRFAPVYYDYLWGGQRIVQRFHRQENVARCAESWEIADRPEGMSRIVNGPLAGSSLQELVARFGERLLGWRGRALSARTTGHRFPLLVKILDARLRLSVQVHPDTRGAHRIHGEPKTEMWYVLEAGPRSFVFLGLRSGANQKKFLRALQSGGLSAMLRPVRAVPETAFLVPGGCIHAIGEGCLLLEIQQNSNTTCRVYDWDRVDADGKPRPLHLDQALRVIRWSCRPPGPLWPRPLRTGPGGNVAERLVRCAAFCVTRLRLCAPWRLRHTGRSFSAYFVASGQARVAVGTREERLSAGDSFLIPAATRCYTIEPHKGKAVLLQARL